ncbi:ubiquitin carboxyl-terminal hydrolase 37, partial [Elysia marginata]
MKDYSKSQRSNAAVNFGKGLGPANFYGAEKSLMTENAYRGLNRRPASSNSSPLQNGLRSPKVKRPKLCDLDADRENKVVLNTSSKALLSNRMAASVPTLSDPQEGRAGGSAENKVQAVNENTSERRSEEGTVGFENLGNTCFINSPLQCLSSLEPLSLDIQSAMREYGPQLPPNSITKMLYLLMKDIRRSDVRSERVRETLTRLRRDFLKNFPPNTQQDAHELLNELLIRSDDEVKAVLPKKDRKKSTHHGETADKSPSTSGNVKHEVGTKMSSQSLSENHEPGEMIKSTPTKIDPTPTQNNFTWVSKKSFFYHECKSEVLSSENDTDLFLLLSFDSKTTINLQDCIDKYFESSEVNLNCPKCGKDEKVTMTRKIVRRPRCFILTLMRYHTDKSEARKKLDPVAIPRYTSVVEFCVEDVKAAPAIEPAFMMDSLDLSTEIYANFTSPPTIDECLRDSFEAELNVDLSRILSTINPVSRPDQPPQEVADQNGSSSTLSDKERDEGPPARCRPLPQEQEDQSQPGERTPSFLPTPPSDEERHDGSQADPDDRSQPTCSSPKPHLGERLIDARLPVTPIIAENEACGGGAKVSLGSTINRLNERLMTPLTVDVNAPPKPPRKRNPAGDWRAHVNINAIHNPWRSKPDIRETGFVNFGFFCGNEAEFGFGASLPSESADVAEPVSTSTKEAAQEVIAAVQARADDDKQMAAKVEPQDRTWVGQIGKKTSSASDNLSSKNNDRDLPDGEDQKEGKEEDIDPDEKERRTINRLANLLADHFAEVEQHIEMAREAGEDFSDIYIQAQGTTVKMNEIVGRFLKQSYEFQAGETEDSYSYKMAEQNALCDALIQRALVSDNSDEEYDYHRVREELILLRYDRLHGEVAKLNHIINDLAIYLAAKEVGVVVDPDSPKRRKMSSGRVKKSNTSSDHNYECVEGMEKNSLDRGEADGECTSHGEVFMEEDSGNRGSLEVNHFGLEEDESESWTGVSSPDKSEKVSGEGQEGQRRASGHCERILSSKRNKDKVESQEEDSSGALADVSNNATINTTNGLSTSICDAAFLDEGLNKSVMDDPMFLGKPVSEWPEQALLDIEVNSLSEEDMMIYAQALSRFEYEREQINHRVSTSASNTGDMDQFTLDDIVDSNEDTAISYDSSSSPKGKATSGNASQEVSESGDKFPGEVSSTSGSSLSETDIEKDASMPKSPERKSDSTQDKSVSKRLPELHCEETLSDLDEPDGTGEETEAAKAKGLKGGQGGTRLCSPPSKPRSRRKFSDSERHSRSSGHEVAGDEHWSPSTISPPLNSQDNVLSPHKGLSNHTNNLSVSSKSSTSTNHSSEQSLQHSSHSNHSPQHQPRSPTASSLSSTSGGGLSATKSRDVPMLSPTPSQLSPRKDTYSLSQSKSARNELARLRSPSSASPRKRVCKEPSSASLHAGSKAKTGSASKRLYFEDENISNSRGQSHVKRTLAPEDSDKGLTDNLLEKFSKQEDLINGSLAKSEDGELSDPDGIVKLLSPRKSVRPGQILSSHIPKSKSALGDDQAISIVSNPSNTPHPVPVLGIRHTAVKTIKVESSPKLQHSQILSPSTMQEEGNQPQRVSLKPILEASVSDDVKAKQDVLDGEKAEPFHMSPRSKAQGPQVSLNDEKENVADSVARRERLENIE